MGWGEQDFWSTDGKKLKNKMFCTLLEEDHPAGTGRRRGRWGRGQARSMHHTRRLPSLWILGIQKEINDEKRVKM
jgi:hypothetical protein